MTVKWTPLSLEDARGFLTNYTVFYKLESDTSRPVKNGGSKTVSSENNYTEVGGLEANKAYIVSVGASTIAGLGNLSIPILLDGVSEPASDSEMTGISSLV